MCQCRQDGEIADRSFVREAKSAAALDHPFICNTYEVAETVKGHDFIVMEYVEGLPAARHLTDASWREKLTT